MPSTPLRRMTFRVKSGTAAFDELLENALFVRVRLRLRCDDGGGGDGNASSRRRKTLHEEEEEDDIIACADAFAVSDAVG